jgi:hypothetical protein
LLGNVYLGGQNFSWCCLKAVENALAVEDGAVVIKNNERSSIGAANITELQHAVARNQFPCGAKYNGDPQGAMTVEIQYAYLVEQCPGWQISSQTNLNAWLHSLSGFLLPAVIFCLSVPRRRKLYIFKSFFVTDLEHPGGPERIISAVFGAIGAGLIVLLDTVIWLSICFAFAGPMILSGLYEAMLDNRVLQFLREKIMKNELALDMRCRCLMIILIGNLDLALEPESDSSHDGGASAPLLPPISTSGGNLDGIRSDERFGLGPPTESRRRSNGQWLEAGPLESHALLARNPSGGTNPELPVARTSSPEPLATPIAGQGSWRGHRAVSSQQPRPMTRNSQVSARTIQRRSTAKLPASPWRHMEALLYELRLYDDEDEGRSMSPRQWPRQVCEDGDECTDKAHRETPRERDEKIDNYIHKTKTRLRAMLHCQYSFGSIVGAPVIFFLGGFIFAFLTSLDNLGDEDIAESIAFGSWYMVGPDLAQMLLIPRNIRGVWAIMVDTGQIIPHIAVVSGLLLAGNNPNILEGVFATERDDKPEPKYFLGLRFELVYPSCYKVAWQWHRGHNKKQWLDQLFRTYGRKGDSEPSGSRSLDPDMEDLRAKITLSPLDWSFVLSLTLLLLGLPYVLALLTAYFTPQIGLSCRSLTFTIYFCIEIAQICLWVWAYAGPPPALKMKTGFQPLNFFRKGGWLDRNRFYAPTSLEWLVGRKGHRKAVREVIRSKQFWTLRTFWCVTYLFAQGILGFGAILSSLGGTLMQIIGVYRTALCYTNAPYWLKPYKDRPMVVLSTNTAEMIKNAVGELNLGASLCLLNNWIYC